jgi:hypothetical protein
MLKSAWQRLRLWRRVMGQEAVVGDGKDGMGSHPHGRRFRLGRKPRGHDARIPKMAVARAMAVGRYVPVPAEVDYAAGLPVSLGVMLNSELGDCTAAACGHAIQVWTANAQPPMVTPADSQILSLYEATGGYVPGNPNTDNGAIEQVVLGYWLKHAVDGNELAAFVEVNPADMSEVRRAVWESGVVYIGFNVPGYLMDGLTEPGSVWDVQTSGDTSIVGGHAVIVVGYESTGNLIVISWGSVYCMTPKFWARYVDEAYALANAAWIERSGRSPAGLTLAQLKALMKDLNGPLPVAPQRRHRHWRRVKRRERAAAAAAAKPV